MTIVRAIVEHVTELEEVVLDWRKVLAFDGGPRDAEALQSLVSAVEGRGRSIFLVGQEVAARYVAGAPWSTVPTVIAAAYRADPPADLLARIKSEASGADAIIVICETDRFNGMLIAAALPSGAAHVDFDAFLEAGAPVPATAWLAKYDHIYPFKAPPFEIETGLDVLLLDVPARSLAQLPIGFAYVYKAVHATGLKIQAIDLDIIAYHRYHGRRCINQWPNVVQEDGLAHPPDPWQAADYLCWTDPNFIDYFNDLLEETISKIVAAKPKVLGFSLHQTSHAFIKRVVDRIRKELPETVIIAGGMSCYQHAVALYVFPEADYVVIGESDTAVGPLVLALARGERPGDLPGIVSHYDTPGRKFIGAPLPHNLDFLGGPDYGFTDLDNYRNWNNYRLMPVVGSRGCGWSRCTFCAERFNWRARTPEKVAEEIEYYTTRGFQDFVFNESDFNSNPEFVVRLCKDIIRRGLNIRLTAQLRISKNSDFEYFQIMKQAGFSCLRFGVDGLAKNTLRLQKKGYVKEDVINNLRDCATLGIYTEINVVIGVPGETDEDVQETADFIIEMKPYIGRVAFINPLMMFVGSVYYNEPEAHDIKFNRPKEELYKEYVVSLPDDSWYSENPLITHETRRERFMQIVKQLHVQNVPMGDFAAFTAKHREDHVDDSHTIASERVRKGERAPALKLVEKTREGVAQTTEPDSTFYGAWSAYDRNEAAKNGALQHHQAEGLEGVIRQDGKVLRRRADAGNKTRFVPFYPRPQLLETYEGFNLVGFEDRVFGAPHTAGVLNLTVKADQDHPLVINGASVEEVKQLVRWIRANADGAPTPLTTGPQLVGHHRGYNLVAYRNLHYAAPVALGPLNLEIDEQRRTPGILVAETASHAEAMIDNILEPHAAERTSDMAAAQ